jgi:hypothetical protein
MIVSDDGTPDTVPTVKADAPCIKVTEPVALISTEETFELRFIAPLPPFTESEPSELSDPMLEIVLVPLVVTVIPPLAETSSARSMEPERADRNKPAEPKSELAEVEIAEAPALPVEIETLLGAPAIVIDDDPFVSCVPEFNMTALVPGLNESAPVVNKVPPEISFDPDVLTVIPPLAVRVPPIAMKPPLLE